jgi:hypothetical protein
VWILKYGFGGGSGMEIILSVYTPLHNRLLFLNSKTSMPSPLGFWTIDYIPFGQPILLLVPIGLPKKSQSEKIKSLLNSLWNLEKR